MKLKFVAINLLLTILIIFLAIDIFALWFSPKKDIEETKSVKSVSVSLRKSRERRKTPSNRHDVILKKNLFDPERRESKPSEGPLDIKKDHRGEKHVLFGIMIRGDEKSALVLDKSLQRGEKRTRWVKTGESLGTSTVTEILNDRVIITENSQNSEILLNDPDKPKPRRPRLKKPPLKKTKPKTIKQKRPRPMKKPSLRTKRPR